jgi:hypothetical protein
MKEIILNNGKIALVDDDDFERLNKFKWYVVNPNKNSKYAYSQMRENKKTVYFSMHRIVMGAVKGQFIDHINHNGLDNRKENLRFCTRSENSINRKPNYGKKNSIYKGAFFQRNRWTACIYKDNKKIYLGCFKTELDAALAYNEAAKKLFGDFAYLNDV